MKIGVLTSSRADYGIYVPLLRKLQDDTFFEVEIIAFGTHLSKFHGYTINQINHDNFAKKVYAISSLLANDDAQSIASSYGLTVLKFSDFWSTNNFDLVVCLGDRFEMSAAVQAGIPHGIRFAHFYGGDTTLGAIDDIYRHQITLASQIHFTATDAHKEKVGQLLGNQKDVFAVGSLSLDAINEYVPINREIFYERYAIPEERFILVTFHPETIATGSNPQFANEMSMALEELTKEVFVVVTMPNADTSGTTYRIALEALQRRYPTRILLVENFGKDNYFAAMYYSEILIGNTSSGIVEAASFGKFVVNVGDRQKGRAQSDNILNTPFRAAQIVSAAREALRMQHYKGSNIYFKDDAADAIINIIKKYEKL